MSQNESARLVKAPGIAADAGMCSAVFYATRPEGYNDLNGRILESIYDIIDVGFGPEASKNYVQMVAGLTFVTRHVTGKTFQDSLCALEKAGWRYTPEILSEYKKSKEDATRPAMVENPKYNPKAPLQPDANMREQMVGAFLVNHQMEIGDPQQVEELRRLVGWRGYMGARIG